MPCFAFVYLRIKSNNMAQTVHTLSLELTMELMQEISSIERFDATWKETEKREWQILKQLKALTIVQSVGASSRLDGAKMTDEEVKVLLSSLQISTLESPDEQAVTGYFDAFDTIEECYQDTELSEANLKNLHKLLLSYSIRDEHHRGNYKQANNILEAIQHDGAHYTVFKTTEPGLATEEAMKSLLKWYHGDKETLPLVKIALFVFDFLRIHPFQDGNGRLSRLVVNWLLLKHGYGWIRYASFEHEIESRKAEYYKVLMQKQKQQEPLAAWLDFFFSCMVNLQRQLSTKLATSANKLTQLTPREKNILAFIENHPGCKSGEIAGKLNIPQPTVKKMLTALVEQKTIAKHGVGAGTNYLIETRSALKKDLMFKLTGANRKKEFVLSSPSSFIEIKKILLTPLFAWSSAVLGTYLSSLS